MSKKTWVHHSPSNRNTTCLAENPELNLCHWNWVWGLLKLYLFSLTHLKPISFKTCLCLCTGLASHNWWISTLNMGKTWGIFEELGELCFFQIEFISWTLVLTLPSAIIIKWVNMNVLKTDQKTLPDFGLLFQELAKVVFVGARFLKSLKRSRNRRWKIAIAVLFNPSLMLTCDFLRDFCLKKFGYRVLLVISCHLMSASNSNFACWSFYAFCASGWCWGSRAGTTLGWGIMDHGSYRHSPRYSWGAKGTTKTRDCSYLYWKS